MKINATLPIFLLLFSVSAICYAELPANYKGKPYIDKKFNPVIQTIPGRIETAFFDRGGEGVAYHDTDATNNGSGVLNREPIHIRPGISKDVVHFREDEGVDISFTKDFADFHHKNNLVWPQVNQLYIGWEADGEWANYTVDVKVAGKYRVICLYGFKDNKSSLWINGKKAVDIVLPVDTGSFHAWNNAHVATIEFKDVGLNLVTLKYNEGSNLAYFDFALIREPGTM